MSENEPEDEKAVNAECGWTPRNWKATVTQSIASAAQRTALELDSVARWARRHLVQLSHSGPLARQGQPVGPLVEKLTALLREHGDSDYESAGRDPRFWALIGLLNSRRPPSRTRRRPARAATTAQSGPERADAMPNPQRAPRRRFKKGGTAGTDDDHPTDDPGAHETAARPAEAEGGTNAEPGSLAGDE